jgi:hypothetical protein
LLLLPLDHANHPGDTRGQILLLLLPLVPFQDFRGILATARGRIGVHDSNVEDRRCASAPHQNPWAAASPRLPAAASTPVSPAVGTSRLVWIKCSSNTAEGWRVWAQRRCCHSAATSLWRITTMPPSFLHAIACLTVNRLLHLSHCGEESKVQPKAASEFLGRELGPVEPVRRGYDQRAPRLSGALQESAGCCGPKAHAKTQSDPLA